MGHGADDKWTITKDMVTDCNNIDIKDIEKALETMRG